MNHTARLTRRKVVQFTVKDSESTGQVAGALGAGLDPVAVAFGQPVALGTGGARHVDADLAVGGLGEA